MRIVSSFLLISALIAVGGALPQNAGAAESACQGLEKPVCEGKEQCSWVSGYTTKKGTEVSPFCRSKPGRKNSSTQSGKASQS